MTINKKISIFFLIPVFILIASLTLIPGVLLAQEEGEEELISLPEELTVDVSFNEVVNYGIIGASFEFGIDVKYVGDEAKTFGFDIQGEDGWEYVILPEFGDAAVTKIKLSPDKPETLKFIARPLVVKERGDYPITLSVFSVEEGDDLQETADLIAVVKPAGDLVITSKSERLNTDIDKNRDNEFVLLLENIGTGPVEEIEISVVDQPEGWLIDFDNKIKIIEVGEAIDIKTNIIPSEKTIAGDYTIRFLAQSDESSAFVDIRTTVKVPLIWQITGIAIIVVVVAGIAVMFERLGRR